MNRKYNILISVIFCFFIGIISVASIIIPDKSFSEMENRNLEPVPELTSNRLFDGRYMSDASDYVADQIAFRNEWVALKATCELLSGKKENNGVFFADGALINCVSTPEQAKIIKNTEYINTFTSNTDVPVYFALIPTAASIWHDRLPKNAVTADERYWTDFAYSCSDAICINLFDALSAHCNEYIFYRTDHHWTSLGAFYGGNELLVQMGEKPLKLSDYKETIVSTQFLGTTYSSSGAWWVSPDSIASYIPDENIEVISNFKGISECGCLYDKEKLEGKNKYAYFLGGNQPLCVISTHNNGEKLLVIRDSYTDCLAPMLTQRFSETHLIDPRYYRLSIKDYISENKIDKVLVLYSFSSFAEHNNLNLFHLEK